MAGFYTNGCHGYLASGIPDQVLYALTVESCASVVSGHFEMIRYMKNSYFLYKLGENFNGC